MNRIRRYFVEVAPEAEQYLIMPTTDDPWTTLQGAGITESRWWSGFVTAYALVGTVNSVVVGAIAGLIGGLLTEGAMISGVAQLRRLRLERGATRRGGCSWVPSKDGACRRALPRLHSSTGPFSG